MKISILFILIAFVSCNKDCPPMSTNCIDYDIIPNENVKNSKDLTKYLLKEDSTYFVNGDTFFASAIKIVPSQGFIEWNSNNYINIYRGRYGLAMQNFADTIDWRNQLEWSYSRELLSAQFDINKIGKQKLVDMDTYLKDTTLLRGSYIKLADGGDATDARWKVDMNHESYIEITHIDSTKNIFEGNFDLYYKLERQSALPKVKYSEKAHFRCGKFKAIFKE